MNEFEIDDYWIYQQPGGCVEIGQKGRFPQDADDLIHFCNPEDLAHIIDNLKIALEKQIEIHNV